MSRIRGLTLRKLKSQITRFALASRGNVGVIFALTILPGIALVGLGVDYSRSITAKSTLDAAADAAALGAATLAQASLQSPGGTSATAVYAGQYAGQQVFAANAVKVGQWIGAAPSPTVNVQINGMKITANVSYSTTVRTSFGGIFGIASLPISGKAASSLTLPSYLNISVAVDVSQSMGLAATQAGMTKLQSLTPDSCAFGCHVVSQDQAGGPAPYNTVPYEQIAHQNGVQLRIDVIQQATQSMISTAKSLQGSSGMISFGLYTIQGGVGQTFGTLSPPSTNYDALITAAQGIDLGANTSGGVGDSNFTGAMPALTAAVPTSGNGQNAANAQQFVFLMTDGVQDVAGPCVDGHCTQPFDPSLCTNLKNKGVTVGVIYTTYLQMNTDQRYKDLVLPFDTRIAPNLQSCASPSWFYQASDATDIQAAINALFARATSRGVLTQ